MTKRSGFVSFAIKWSPLLLNKYLLAGIIFILYLSFFDRSSLVTRYQLLKTVKHLKAERALLMWKTEEAAALRADIVTNKEKYARERFFMKRSGEQVFILD